jgi:hypothetical protein
MLLFSGFQLADDCVLQPPPNSHKTTIPRCAGAPMAGQHAALCLLQSDKPSALHVFGLPEFIFSII